MTEKLKPCPFCGGKASTHQSTSLDLGLSYSEGPGVGCTVCHYCICRSSLREAAIAWNIRDISREAEIRKEAIAACADFAVEQSDAWDRVGEIWRRDIALVLEKKIRSLIG